jgi:hypothetical protein
LEVPRGSSESDPVGRDKTVGKDEIVGVGFGEGHWVYGTTRQDARVALAFRPAGLRVKITGPPEGEPYKGCGKRCSKLPRMLFMVIERFKERGAKLVGERYEQKGRMLPDGVTYIESWMDPSGAFCYQIVDSPNQELLNAWMSRWDDLVEFEVVPVLRSEEYWKKKG